MRPLMSGIKDSVYVYTSNFLYKPLYILAQSFHSSLSALLSSLWLRTNSTARLIALWAPMEFPPQPQMNFSNLCLLKIIFVQLLYFLRFSHASVFVKNGVETHS